ncbi:MAG: class IV adenylate cyclase [Methanotrichaceae archaeon]|nr:class IV adenylate cyclase [Methanotrichaceae archaeon]
MVGAIEVEVKAKAPEGAEEMIASLGAIFLGVEHHHDLYFSSPERDMAKRDEALRLRIKESGSFLTFKGPRLERETKSRREITLEVDDAIAAEEMLEAIGFSKAAEVRKSRAKYRLGHVTIALDDVEGLGSFIEVEALGGEDWAMEKEEVLAVLGRLGIVETIPQSYLELLEADIEV